MIDRETIAKLAKLHGLRPWQQEKHYIQALILVSIAEQPVVFKGGTYLWFFHGLNRFSEDIDFTANGMLPQDLAEKVSETLRLFGVENSVKKIADDDRTLSFRISAKGPLNTSDKDLCHVYVEISKRENIAMPTQVFELNVDAYGLPVKIINCLNLEETSAEKVRAIMTRDAPRDVFDLYFLIAKKGVTFNHGLVNKKLDYYKTSYSKEVFRRKMLDKKDAWNRELGQFIFGKTPDFKVVIQTINNWAG